MAQLERPEQAEFEAGEQQGGAGLEGAGGGLMQDAQQHKGDQRDIDLDAHGVFAAAEEAADFEVLLEPFEQEFDGPALFVEPGDFDIIIGPSSVEGKTATLRVVEGGMTKPE